MAKNKEKYEKLKEKYKLKLPSFETLDNEFEIFKIDEEEFSLAEIRKKIIEKFESANNILTDMLQPENTIGPLTETKAFTDEEKTKLFELYRKYMFFVRFSNELYIDTNNEKEIGFINQALEAWKENKKELLEIVRKVKESWKQEVGKKEYYSYLG